MRVKQRNWWIVLLLLWAALVFNESLIRSWDVIDKRPFVTAKLTVIGTTPFVKYEINARVNASGVWTATVHRAEDNKRLATRKGDGDYSPLRKGGLWTWDDFFTDSRLAFSPPAPPVPDESYYICVFYAVSSNRSDVFRQTKRFCSEVVEP
jgi:hypothetical protein